MSACLLLQSIFSYTLACINQLEEAASVSIRNAENICRSVGCRYLNNKLVLPSQSRSQARRKRGEHARFLIRVFFQLAGYRYLHAVFLQNLEKSSLMSLWPLRQSFHSWEPSPQTLITFQGSTSQYQHLGRSQTQKLEIKHNARQVLKWILHLHGFLS